MLEKGTRETAMGAAICGSATVHRMKKGPSWVSRESIHTAHHRGIASNEVLVGHARKLSLLIGADTSIPSTEGSVQGLRNVGD